MNEFATLDRLHRHFAQQLGCRPEDLARGNQQLVTCELREQGNPSGPPTPLWALSRGNGWVVSVSSDAYSTANNVLQTLPTHQTPLSEQARQRLHETLQNVAPISFYYYGPLYYVDQDSFRPLALQPVRLVTSEDLSALQASRHPLAKERNRIEAGDVFAAWVGSEIRSYAQILRASEDVWEVTVVTEAPYRRQGYGKSAVSAATQAVLDACRVPVYSCDGSNRASQRLAESLGYQKYGDDFVCLGRASG